MQTRTPIIRDLSVIIPTVGRESLAHCIRSLVAGTMGPHAVIVCDQSPDGEVARRMAHNVPPDVTFKHLHRPQQRGAAAGRNTAIAAVTSRWLLAIDDDCVADAAWIQTMHAALLLHPQAIVTGQVMAGRDGHVPSTITDADPVAHRRPSLRRDVLYTGNMGCASAVIRSLGGFSEAQVLIPSAQDNELAYRALRSSVTIHYEPGVRVVHLGQGDVDVEANQQRYALGQGGFFGLHVRRWDSWIAVRAVIEVARGLWQVLRGAFQRRPELVMRGRISLSYTLTGFIRGWLEEHRTRRGSGIHRRSSLSGR